MLLRKKRTGLKQSDRHPTPFFDLLRLFAGIACSKITQIFCL
ncbi:hypothetical protein HMPREF0201_04744 [Cedecea davisae DSM 4568]|uniref:Uncharacterized protein n=1 Tax=Cedecea davisae DSM 4568 TaxID=566551 RepID=S3JHL1_9ENTR|nr:hypothetical protein HMPREF0201_04744 [Cedecea davisae DSM 4568]